MSEVRSEAYVRPCTCHPDDNPPVPCAQQYALNECRAKALGDAPAPCAWRRPMNANLAGFSTDDPVEQRRRDAALFTPGGYVSEEGSMNESPALESALAKLRASIVPNGAGVGLSCDEAAALLAKIEEADRLADAAEELRDLMAGVKAGDYMPDSFTNQPVDAALAVYRNPQPAGGGES